MHPSFQKAMGLTKILVNAAIEVHRDKGPGLVESIYEWCLEKELELRSLRFLAGPLCLHRDRADPGLSKEGPRQSCPYPQNRSGFGVPRLLQLKC